MRTALLSNAEKRASVLAVEPNFGGYSGTRYFETPPCKRWTGAQVIAKPVPAIFACLAIATTDLSTL